MSDSLGVTEDIHSPLIGNYFTLSEGTKRLPRVNGRKVHPSTLWRWCRRGCNGVHLKYLRAGRSIMVTEEYLHQFFTELAAADAAVQTTTTAVRKRKPRRRNNSAARQRQIDEANEVLVRAGILKP
jgi:hypothetical protein